MTEQEADFIRNKLRDALDWSSIHDVASVTQNAAADAVAENPSIGFDDWLKEVVNAFVRDCEHMGVGNPPTVYDVVIAVLSDAACLKELQDELDGYKEAVEDDDFLDDEDFDDEDE